ncbi:hypothetical protein HMPREF0591_6384 [Mycobacterium parascrofulaceum ATCC BAA-614]|uniref:Uncharacterized protein n=1 Tax=Mycobacterium parascrofulaceum ATCC BAA-614 TaxID=525368 RepID=D5PJP0_9MYCO|nr:hypothetical protein HMPREF0591_6384 [Mycobacterium parascrofulaceum ATCC BAA-614]
MSMKGRTASGVRWRTEIAPHSASLKANLMAAAAWHDPGEE